MKFPTTKEEKKEALTEIAEEHVWGSEDQKRFVKFGMLFWGEQKKPMDFNYVSDWVRRFNQGSEYLYADQERLKMLKKVDGIAGAKRHAREGMKRAGWKPAYIAERLKDMGL